MTPHQPSRRDAEEYGDQILSKAVKAGRRTYFFDVRATRGDDYFLTITESRKMQNPDGSFSYDRHKIFLYKEDFAKFSEGLSEAVDFIRRSKPEFFERKPEPVDAAGGIPDVKNRCAIMEFSVIVHLSFSRFPQFRYICGLNTDDMKFTQYLLLAAKGCAMGMADVVPGVSGGTIAFISGIYEELIESIKSVNGTALRLLGTLRLKEFWRHVNGRFLLPVLIGIGIAIFSLARLMTYLLTHHPIAIWSFFFGLIVASALLVARQIGHWNVRTVAACLVGAAAAWWITIATPTETPDTWWFIMLSGAIAICAMILPGISGAFILLLLGKYQFIMQAVGDLNIPVIVIFVVGAVAGIISFSHLLSWLLKHWHDVTVAVLMGFMVGSLNKVWPWKEVVETYTDSHGKIMPLVESNVAPGRFEALTQQDALLAEAIVLCIVGFLAIYCIELAARIVVKKQEE